MGKSAACVQTRDRWRRRLGNVVRSGASHGGGGQISRGAGVCGGVGGGGKGDRGGQGSTPPPTPPPPRSVCRQTGILPDDRASHPSIASPIRPSSPRFAASLQGLLLAHQMKVLGVKFAPLRVPLERRLQTLAASLWFITFGFGNLIAGLLVLAIFMYTQYLRLLVLIYLAWMWYDKDICETGGRRCMWIRSIVAWNYFREYFPLRLEKTVDLTPDRNYLFCVYPHGVLSAGAFGQFGNEFAPFRDMFPGLEPYVHTLYVHFITPFFREIILGLGGCSASKKSVSWVLGSPGAGRVGILIVGGAAESLHCRPGVYRIILKRRKGFVKLALQNGTPLVPVFSFGETDLYDQMHNPEGSLLRRFQEFVRRVTTVAPVVPIGRGYFQYSFGLVPRRSPVTTVVGRPVEVPKIPEPTKEDIDKYHKQFQESISTLFEENKHKYIPNADKTFLEIE